MSSKCAEPRPKKTDARTQFAFLRRSAAGRRMTVEDQLEQLSGIWIRSFKYAGVEEDIVLNVEMLTRPVGEVGGGPSETRRN